MPDNNLTSPKEAEDELKEKLFSFSNTHNGGRRIEGHTNKSELNIEICFLILLAAKFSSFLLLLFFFLNPDDGLHSLLIK